MSANTHADSTASDPDVPHPRYTAVNRRAHGSQQAVADAWADGEYPTHNTDDDGTAVLYTGSPADGDGTKGRTTNFYGEQHPDGSGVLMHYDTREAIRTASGVIISNAQCWATGFARCSTPDYDHRLPLDAIERFMDDGDSWDDLLGVVGSSVADFGEYGVAIGRDPSIINGSGRIAFRVDQRQVALAKANGVSEMIQQALRPLAVQASDRRVVDADEYRKTKLDADERQAHVEAGGQLSESHSRWRDERINRQHYRADLQGEVIVRHGEWFFIPDPDADPDTTGATDAGRVLDNHRSLRTGGHVMPYPKACPACDGSSFELQDGREATCNICGEELLRPIYIRGEVIHAEGDHNAVNLGETWHRAVTHDKDVLVYDPHPGRDDPHRSTRRGRGRGRSRAGRWD